MNVTSQQITDMRAAIASAFAARAARELAKDASNSNMQRNLTRYAKDADHDKVAEVLCASNFDVSHIDRNAYSVEKAIDIARYCVSAAKLSVYCNAIFDSMLSLETAKVEITRDVLASVCSNDIKTKYDAKIKSTRVQTVKSKSTVATQHNSSINAMLALHMLNTSRNSANDETFTLDRSNYAVQQIAARKNVALVAVDAA